MKLPLETPVAELPGMNPARVRAFARLGIVTIGELFRHYPRRHEDRSRFQPLPEEETSGPVCLTGEIAAAGMRRFGRRRMFEATLRGKGDGLIEGQIVLRWFGLAYIHKLVVTGMRVVVYGQVKRKGKRLCMDHPELEPVEDSGEGGEAIHMGRIVPVHPATEGLNPRAIRAVMHRALGMVDLAGVERFVPEILDPMQEGEALRAIHFPANADELTEARRHLVLGEFLGLQLLVAWRREEIVGRDGVSHFGGAELADRFHEALPYALTGAQRRVITEVRGDLKRSVPMNRLVQGDVGSGKTVVAATAILDAVSAGYQAAFMAPTQILAGQHYQVLAKWFEPLGVRVALRTGARKADSGLGPLFEMTAGEGRDALAGEFGRPAPPKSSYEVATDGEARYWRRALPHFERPWGKYMITFRTAESQPLSDTERKVVLEAATYWHQRRFHLYAACVMPDHVHLLFEPMVKEDGADGAPVFWGLAELLHSIRSFSAHQIGKLRGAGGKVWQEEYFDRLIRSEADLQEKFEYICRNPWNSGVVDATEEYPFVWWDTIDAEEGRDAQSDGRDARTPQAGGLGRPARRAGRPAHPDESRIKERPPLSPDAPHVVVGTHALLHEGVAFERLGLVVIDEHHKFGVEQRARLIRRGDAPDVLAMTATPIPRTLAISYFGDLDVSEIDEMPPGRGQIQTVARDGAKVGEAASFLKTQLEKGRQAYVVYPLIDESEKLAAGKGDVASESEAKKPAKESKAKQAPKAAVTEFERWRGLVAPAECGLLHGRMSPEEKDRVMEAFRSGATRLLVATTVIEVGIDVPNATVMLVENAERFGLAQLHQLRGRVGRGAHKSFCILLAGSGTPGGGEGVETAHEALGRLAVLERTCDGFEVAEEDMRQRGPGDLLGTQQSGLPPLLLGDLSRDGALMRRAREAAQAIFQSDPRLEQSFHQHFRRYVVERSTPLFSEVS